MLKQLWDNNWGRSACVFVVLLFLGLVSYIALAWPGEETTRSDLNFTTFSAEIIELQSSKCDYDPDSPCQEAFLRLADGSNAGEIINIEYSATNDGFYQHLAEGTDVIVQQEEYSPGDVQYYLVGIDHSTGLFWLILCLAFLLILVSRKQGLLALISLAASVVLILQFILPALEAGHSPEITATIGALASLSLALLLTHGFHFKTIVSIISAAILFPLIMFSALAVIDLLHLSGIASEEYLELSINSPNIKLEGIIVAGMVIAAAGALDDVIVSQVSTVLALKESPHLWKKAISVGRDHLSAAINTLAMCYLGAALPFLLNLSLFQSNWNLLISNELLVSSIVALLIGSMGLIISVPLTTAIAVFLYKKITA